MKAGFSLRDDDGSPQVYPKQLNDIRKGAVRISVVLAGLCADQEDSRKQLGITNTQSAPVREKMTQEQFD